MGSLSKKVLYGGKLWRVQTLAKWQGKYHWQNKLWRIDDESLIKRALKQFNDTSAPNLIICARVCTYVLLVNYVGWLLSFLVASMIRGYHEYKLIWNDPTSREELEYKREPGNLDDYSFLSKHSSAALRAAAAVLNAMLSSFLANSNC